MNKETVANFFDNGNSWTLLIVGYLFCLSDVFVGGSCLLLVVDCRFSVVEC